MIPIVLVFLLSGVQFFTDNLTHVPNYGVGLTGQFKYKFFGMYFPTEYTQTIMLITSISLAIAVFLIIYLVTNNKNKRKIFWLALTPILLKFIILAFLKQPYGFAFGIKSYQIAKPLYYFDLVYLLFLQMLLMFKVKYFNKPILLAIFILIMTIVLAEASSHISCNIIYNVGMFCGLGSLGYFPALLVILFINIVWLLILSIKKRKQKTAH